VKCAELQELAALEAAGALDLGGRARLEAAIADDDGAQDEIRGLRDAMAAFATATTRPVAPTASLKEKLIARIRQTPQAGTQTRPASRPESRIPGFSFVSTGDTDWVETSLPGLRARLLATNPREGYQVRLLELKSGAFIPRHLHAKGPEEIFLVSGDLQTEGRLLGPGDYLHSDAGTDHRELFSPNGCVALMIEPVEGPVFVGR
jgi:anti-sigma factor ChrR (cupin superfamily)